MPLIFCGRTVAYADAGGELSDNVTSILNGIDLSELEDYLSKYGDAFIFSYGKTAREIIEYLLSGKLNLNYGDYLSGIFSVLLNGVKSFVPAFAQIIAISILCALASDAQGGVLSKSTSNVIHLACMALIMLILSSMLFGIISAAVESIKSIKRQIEIFTPILVTLTVLCGGSESGAIYQPAALFLSSGAIEMVNGLIFPATVAVIVLNFISRLSPDVSFTGVAALIKSVMKWVIGLTVAIFGIFITVQSSASSLFNGIFFKVTKYLVGNSVPIVGNFLSAGVEMVVMSGTLVRSSLGLTGILLIVSQTVAPVIQLISFSLMLKCTGAISQPLGEKRLYEMYSVLSKDVEYFIAGILMVAFLYILVIMLIINSTYAFL